MSKVEPRDKIVAIDAVNHLIEYFLVHDSYEGMTAEAVQEIRRIQRTLETRKHALLNPKPRQPRTPRTSKPAQANTVATFEVDTSNLNRRGRIKP